MKTTLLNIYLPPAATDKVIDEEQSIHMLSLGGSNKTEIQEEEKDFSLSTVMYFHNNEETKQSQDLFFVFSQWSKTDSYS